MTQYSTGDFTSMLKDGKLKPGIYKIQYLGSNSYLDTNLHSKQVCTRPTLSDGRGLVCLYLLSAAHESDIYKRKIKPISAGYTVWRVSRLI